ncbi:deoxynucleotidyltransferase terminal-interacting protein 2 [Rhagoletis pomonella]|uniref:deoxynucleotidyltransferase terminal-interacting protein 2 n=1 Tax=Rhagoletis pomonella TaxID=28610 RepID=UPI0017869DAA|nr:deoxynucleotidyltransferase terminal-interacting protein 2 [Rhagoletis pomonella]
MSLYVLDSTGDTNLLERESHGTATVENKLWRTLEETTRQSQLEVIKCTALSDESRDNEDDEDYFGLPPPNVDISQIIREELPKLTSPKTKHEEELDKLTEKIDATILRMAENPKKNSKTNCKTMDFSDYNPATGKFDVEHQVKTDVGKEMAKSQLVDGFGRLKELPFFNKKKLRDIKRIERSKTKGPGWYNLPATEQTEETTNELKILQMRSVLDPKHFYKKNDLKVLPKYFQIGTVQHSPLDYYSERGTRHKKCSLVDDLLEDDTAKNYTKRKFKEVIVRREKYAHRKAMQKMKKQKKNKS